MRIDDLRRVLIVGAGRMGTEIALQCAIGGYDVVLHDISEKQLEAAGRIQRECLHGFVSEGRLTAEEAQDVAARIVATPDVAAAATVDLINESAPENLKLKRDLFARFHSLCPPHTVFTSNTSYLRPSQMVSHVGRPERFSALHFHPPVWKSNVVDIMPHDGTAPEIVELLKQFSGRIGQIPIVCRHQGEGYIFNTMLRTWLLTAISLADSGIGSVEDIDRSWMGVMLSKVGPFGILDNIGLDTVSDILKFWGMILRDPQAQRASAYLKPYVDAGHLGIKTKKGFYEYPGPAYLRPDFLTAEMFQGTKADSLIRRFMAFERDGGRARSVERPAKSSPASAAVESSSDASADVPHRYLLKVLPTPVHQKLKHAVRFHGPCLILGDNADAQALAAKLGALGGEAVILPAAGGVASLQGTLDALWSDRAFPHLFVMSARDPAARTMSAAARFEEGLIAPFLVGQRWYAEVMKRGLFETATIVGCTAMGGDFGASGRISAAESGGIAGLLKAIYLEGAVRSSLGPQVKVIDAPIDQPPEQTADQILRELALAQASVVTGSRDESRRRYVELEVGYARGIRHQVFLEPADAEPASEGDDLSVTPGSVWVVTGGARGITGFVARELGKRYRLKLHLLGTTPAPTGEVAQWSEQERAAREQAIRAEAAAAGTDPDRACAQARRSWELARELAKFEAEGVRARYHACDVTDAARLAETLQAIRAEDGGIAGVLHGAGLEIGAKLPEKRLADVRATLAVKTLGMSHLIEQTERDSLQWFIAFGSLAGRFGNFAQSDYSMANELLAKQLVALRAQRPECRCTVFHWPGWTEVGMAARPDGEEGLKRGHHTFLSPALGLEYLLQELRSDAPAGEVVIVHPNEVPLEMRLARSTGGKRAPTWQR